MNALKALARDALAQTLLTLGMSSPAKVCRGKLLILTFHRVLPAELRRQYPMPGLAVTPEELHWILSTLLPHFEVNPVTAAVRRLRSDQPQKPVLAISFDDGQWDNLAYAAPVLGTLGVAATFYVPTDYIGTSTLLWHDMAAFAWQRAALPARRDILRTVGLDARIGESSSVSAFLEALKTLAPEVRESTVARLAATSGSNAFEWARLMDWKEIAELQQMGHEIGSHSCSHALLPQLDLDGQRKEMEVSMRAIAQAIGERPVSMCYPNGSYDARSIEVAAAVGYENAVTTRWGINSPDQPAYELLRCDMDARRLLDRHGVLSHARLAMRLSGLQPGLAA